MQQQNPFLNSLQQAPPQVLMRNNVEFPQSTAQAQLLKQQMQQQMQQRQGAVMPQQIQQPRPQVQVLQQKFQQQAPILKQLPPSECDPVFHQPYCAYDEKTKEFFSNQTIFDKKIQGLKFTALVVKELKSRFALEYEKYKTTMSHMEQTNPDLVKQQVRSMIGEFFQNLKGKVKELQKDVMENIKNSENLKNLEQTLEKSKEFIQHDKSQPDHYEKEKKIFDEKVSKGRYAFVVKRRDFYNNLIDNLEKSRLKINLTIDQSIEYQNRVLRVNNDEKFINYKLGEIVEDCIIVDAAEADKSNAFKYVPPQKGVHQINIQQQPPPIIQKPAIFSQQPIQPLSQPSILNRLIPPSQMSQLNRPLAQTPVVNAQFSQQVRPPIVLAPQQQTQVIQQVQTQTQQAQSDLMAQQLKMQMLQKQASQQLAGQTPAKTQESQVQIQLPKEWQYNTVYKLKSMNVFKLHPGQGWQKFTDHQQLFMAKCIFTLDDTVYTIGGARDQKTKQTIPDVIASQFNTSTNQVISTQKAPMQMSRASFGCLYSPTKNEIYVTGGYNEGELSKKCERYSVAEDKWYWLPDLNEFKCSMSLVLLDDGKYLYSIGGLSKMDTIVQLNTSIERLDLTNPQAQWQVMPIKLNEAACDIGCLALSKDEILIFGGWNRNPLQNAYVLRKFDHVQQLNGFPQRSDIPKHELKMIEGGGLDRPDFFLCCGIAMKSEKPDQVKICGHTSLYNFDFKQRKFVGSQSV